MNATYRENEEYVFFCSRANRLGKIEHIFITGGERDAAVHESSYKLAVEDIESVQQ